MAPLAHVLALSVVLFGLGAIGLLARANWIAVLACLQLMLGAIVLSFVTFAERLGDAAGQGLAVFALAVGVLQLVVGVGVLVALRSQRGSLRTDAASRLRG
ncbi:MAG: NADH-quinone oxidoreductase subunit NuoK [Myxococcota bacterium]|nr:NADH-quinone oxidoreductase subunit NuoK [Myxococcota bacterium]